MKIRGVERGERGGRCEVMVGIGHGRSWCKVTTTKKIFQVRFEKAKSGDSRRDTRANKRQAQERETKSGRRAVAGGAVNRYP